MGDQHQASFSLYFLSYMTDDGVAVVEDRMTGGKGTLVFVALLCCVYAIQLYFANSNGYFAAYDVVHRVMQRNPIVHILFSPFVHSSHGHLANNILFLIIGGIIVEDRVGWKKLITFTYITGVITNTIPYYLKFGDLSVGISGASFGLWTFFGLYYTYISIYERYYSDYNNLPIIFIVISIFGLLYIGVGVAVFFGWIIGQPGGAKGAHFLGILLGGFWVLFDEDGIYLSRQE